MPTRSSVQFRPLRPLHRRMPMATEPTTVTDPNSVADVGHPGDPERTREFSAGDELSKPFVAGSDQGHPNAADKPIEERAAGEGADEGNPPYSGEKVAVTD